jgi:hypothetical protein
MVVFMVVSSPVDALDGLPKQAPRQVALGQLEAKPPETIKQRKTHGDISSTRLPARMGQDKGSLRKTDSKS